MVERLPFSFGILSDCGSNLASGKEKENTFFSIQLRLFVDGMRCWQTESNSNHVWMVLIVKMYVLNLYNITVIVQYSFI